MAHHANIFVLILTVLLVLQAKLKAERALI